jgi:hypothetical protein
MTVRNTPAEALRLENNPSPDRFNVPTEPEELKNKNRGREADNDANRHDLPEIVLYHVPNLVHLIPAFVLNVRCPCRSPHDPVFSGKT